MPQEAGRSTDEGTVAEKTPQTAMVSLNDLAVAVNTLTSHNIRRIIQASRGVDIDHLVACGCDGGSGDCGCFGSNCPCNKLHEDAADIYSIDWFLAQRAAQVAKLRQELEALQISEDQVDRLKQQQKS